MLKNLKAYLNLKKKNS